MNPALLHVHSAGHKECVGLGTCDHEFLNFTMNVELDNYPCCTPLQCGKGSENATKLIVSYIAS